jgi:hypothetical protein
MTVQPIRRSFLALQQLEMKDLQTPWTSTTCESKEFRDVAMVNSMIARVPSPLQISSKMKISPKLPTTSYGRKSDKLLEIRTELKPNMTRLTK